MTENTRTEDNYATGDFGERSFAARIPRGVYESVVAAADTTGMPVEEFVVWAAAKGARDVLSGNVILLDEEKWDEFNAALDAPVENLSRKAQEVELRRLLPPHNEQ